MEIFRQQGILDRCGCGIRKFPMEILQLTNLHHLFLADNELGTFPVAVCQLAQLEALDLSRNKIQVRLFFCFFF